MAILAPVLNCSRQNAKAVVCASNIRQLETAVSVYSSGNDTFPFGFADSNIEPPGGFLGSFNYNRRGWWWCNYIGQFYYEKTDTRNLLCCPAKNIKVQGLKTNILCSNYGVNQSIFKSTNDFSAREEFTGQPLKLTGILRPSETLMIADSGFSLIDWWHVTLDPPNPADLKDSSYVPGMKINTQRIIYPGQENDAIGGRHPDRTVNAGFADNHIETTKADKLLVEKKQEQYENRSPLWISK